MGLHDHLRSEDLREINVYKFDLDFEQILCIFIQELRGRLAQLVRAPVLQTGVTSSNLVAPPIKQLNLILKFRKSITAKRRIKNNKRLNSLSSTMGLA